MGNYFDSFDCQIQCEEVYVDEGMYELEVIPSKAELDELIASIPDDM